MNSFEFQICYPGLSATRSPRDKLTIRISNRVIGEIIDQGLDGYRGYIIDSYGAREIFIPSFEGVPFTKNLDRLILEMIYWMLPGPMPNLRE